jgi:hypothetical protein
MAIPDRSLPASRLWLDLHRIQIYVSSRADRRRLDINLADIFG